MTRRYVLSFNVYIVSLHVPVTFLPFSLYKCHGYDLDS